jgi:hypothetical protein
MLCILLAGLNVALFYLATFRRLVALGPGATPPAMARLAGLLSIGLWTTVIVCGRMITFFRPVVCKAEAVTSFIANCAVR